MTACESRDIYWITAGICLSSAHRGCLRDWRRAVVRGPSVCVHSSFHMQHTAQSIQYTVRSMQRFIILKPGIARCSPLMNSWPGRDDWLLRPDCVSELRPGENWIDEWSLILPHAMAFAAGTVLLGEPYICRVI